MTRREVLLGGAAAGAVALGACAKGAKTAAKQARTLKLLILGGTGFLGPALVRAAQARGHTLTLFNRGKTRPGLFPDVEKLQGDRDGKLQALEGRRWDAVIDTSGYVPRIVRASAELLAPHVGQYVFVSSISVYARTDVVGMDETAEVAKLEDPANEDIRANYGALKALCEQAAEAALPGRVTNVRPGLIVGPEDPTDRFTYWPVRLARGGEVLAPGDGTDPVQFIDVRDLAEWTIHLLEVKQMGVFNALGPASKLTMKELVGSCDRVANAGAQLTWVDAAWLEQEQKVQPWSDLPVWVPGTGESAGFGAVSNARAMAAGLKFRAVDDTVKATLAWWNDQPPERRAKLRSGLSPEREREVLAAWHARAGAATAR